MSDRIKPGFAPTARDQLPGGCRYELLARIASGGMATVYVGRKSGVEGFSRLVAIKRAHAHLLEDPSFGRMLIAEARLASRIHHPNVVAIQDVEELDGELLLVMDYIEGVALLDFMREALAPELRLTPSMVVRVVLDACAGLHAAHELVDDDGAPLRLVHRDVTPHNILIGIDGIGRLADFGIAKSGEGTETRTGILKGKAAYMAPEYIESGLVDVRGDIFSLGIVAWEALTGKRLFRGASDMDVLRLILRQDIPAPSSVAPSLGSTFDSVLLRALAKSPDERFRSARELGEALEVAARRTDTLAFHAEVGERTRALVGDAFERRRALIRGRSSVASAADVAAPVTPAPSAVVAVQTTAPDILRPSYETLPLAIHADDPPADSSALEDASRAMELDPPLPARSGRPSARVWGLTIVAVVLTAGAAVGLKAQSGASRDGSRDVTASGATSRVEVLPVATVSASLPPAPEPTNPPEPAPSPSPRPSPSPSVAAVAVAPAPSSPARSSAPQAPRRPPPRARPSAQTTAEPSPIFTEEPDRAPPNPYAPTR